MATTQLMPLHTGKGRTVGTAIEAIIDYVENPEKTDGGNLITSWQCDSRVADREFLLSKRQYIRNTGRVRGEDDVIAYHLRQSFRPGEITPEEANRLGCELARRFTKGNHAYIVCTHIDKAHIHNHVIWNSTALDEHSKFRNFWGSTYVCGLGNWGTTNHLMTAENYVSFQIANVKNVLTDTGTQGIQPIEEEKFVELGDSMDIMIMDAAAVKNIAPLYQEDPTMFDTCKAWQDGEVYLEMAYNAYYTNFEIALINTWFIAKTVYPEQFADIDLTAKTNEVTKAFLGQELADAIFACPSSFGGYQKIDTDSFFG